MTVALDESSIFESPWLWVGAGVAVVGAAETTELGKIPDMSEQMLHADAALKPAIENARERASNSGDGTTLQPGVNAGPNTEGPCLWSITMRGMRAL